MAGETVTDLGSVGRRPDRTKCQFPHYVALSANYFDKRIILSVIFQGKLSKHLLVPDP